jgi:hypothetical protein
MATFGKTTDGASNSASSADRFWLSQATPSTSGTVVTGHTRADMSTAGGSTEMRFVIYSDSGGEPGSLLATSAEVINTADPGSPIWHSFTFSGGNIIDVTAGTPYWLGMGWDDPGTPTIRWYRNATAGLRRERIFTYPNFPASFGTADATNSGPLDAYVTYTEAASGSLAVAGFHSGARMGAFLSNL